MQQLCANRADGLDVFISTYGKADKPNAIAIFADHTRLLGTNPASWTTAPLASLAPRAPRAEVPGLLSTARLGILIGYSPDNRPRPEDHLRTGTVTFAGAVRKSSLSSIEYMVTHSSS